jgi:nucleotide-binding universal stress UspA family protein
MFLARRFLLASEPRFVMYKRILVPIDGGKLTERAIHASIELAIQLGASITGFVVGRLPPASFLRSSAVDEDDGGDDEMTTTTKARRALAHFESCAQVAGVPYEGVYHQAPRVDRAIIETAESHGCDMIIMVTHGRGAFGEFLYGSQTKAVLAGSKLPLLILK